MDVTQIPFNKYLGIRKQTSDEKTKLILPESEHFLNHLKTVHAGVQFALAEATSGEYLQRRFANLSMKESLIPMVRKSEVKYKKPAYGKIEAKAHVSDDDCIKSIESISNKGRAIIPVAVQVVDGFGTITMTATFNWFVTKA